MRTQGAKETLKSIGLACMEARLTHGGKLEEVALACNCGSSNVWAFEKGLNNNLLIYMYYHKYYGVDICI